MRRNTFFVLLVSVYLAALASPSCKHEPLVDSNPDPTDTTGNPIDTTGTTGTPCSPDSVYFQNEILPMLISNCTESGCHNANDHQDGVILDSYANILASVENVTLPDWDENELIEALTTTDLDERMPPLPNESLTTQQINRLKQWVSQGAQNNSCNEQYGNACDTTAITYTTAIQPLIQAKCQGCHGASSPSAGIGLTTYAQVKTVAQNGKLLSSITRTTNWMPNGGAKLDNCTINKVRAWINDGTPQ